MNTKANPADEPSRNMSLAHSVYVPVPDLRSEPVPVVLPAAADLDSVRAWMRARGFARPS